MSISQAEWPQARLHDSHLGAQTQAALPTSACCDLTINVSLNDISLYPAPAHTPALQKPEVVFPAIASSLVILVCVMTWALPLSSMLAINLFRVSVVLWLLLAFRPGSTWKHSRIFLPMLCFFA